MFIGPCGSEKKKKEGKGPRDGVKEDLGERSQSGLLSKLVEMSQLLLFLLPSYLGVLFFSLLISMKLPWGRVIVTTAN